MPGELERYYDIFGLKPGASLKEIKHVYHELVNIWHPDRFQGDPAMQQVAEEKLKHLNEAYTHLQACLTQAPACPPRYRQILSKIGAAAPPWGQGVPHGKRRLFFLLALPLAALGGLILVYLYFAGPGRTPPPPMPVPARQAADQQPTFILGATTQEVLAAMGPPTSIHLNTWMYGMSSVTFSQGRVSGYDNVGGNLRLKVILPADNHEAYFTIGSTPEEVLAVQGTPTAVKEDTWKYGLSTIRFENQRVSRYSNLSQNLKVRLLPPPHLAAHPPEFFDLGSTQEEVLAVQGTPTSILPHGWTYGDSTVYFHQGRVIKVNNAGKNLRLKNP